MENEKKNGNPPQNKQNHSGHRRSKNRQQKPKSYFIDPSANQNDAQNAKARPAASTAAEERAKPENTAQDGAQAQNKQHHRPSNHSHNRNHRKAQNNAQHPQEQKTADNAQQNNAPKQNDNKSGAGEQTSAQKPAPKNKNRNKHHSDRNKNERPQNKQTEKQSEQTSDDILQNFDAFTSSSKQSDRLQRPAPQKMTKFADSPEYAQYSDYEEIAYADLYRDEPKNTAEPSKDAEEAKTDDNEPKVEVVGVRFKASGKTYYFQPNGIALRIGTHAIVETARGLEYGEVAIANTMVKESDTVPPLRPVVRKATDADKKHHEDNKEKEDNAFRICNEKIIAHGLDMKLIDAQYTFDNTKLLFYFTSSGRVDFRDLVKDLAAIFRTRIELRQIGIRDEAKMVGGLGMCGRPLCCSLFLTDFGQVSIKMAKEQNLSLNSSKISGICGRLMCCLRYEHETYEYEIKHTPPVDSLVRTVDGVGVVTEINPLAATIKVRLNSSPDTPPKPYKRDEVTILRKKQQGN